MVAYEARPYVAYVHLYVHLRFCAFFFQDKFALIRYFNVGKCALITNSFYK